MRLKRRGSVILDSLIGVLVLGIGAASFFGLYPILQRSEVRAKQESVAVQMSSRVIAHLQLLKPQNLEPATLADLGLIDDGQLTKPSPYSFSNIPLDEGSLYSPAQALPEGQGLMEVEDIEGGCKRVKVSVSWVSQGRRIYVKTGTIVGGYR